jgi:hypothetical protein
MGLHYALVFHFFDNDCSTLEVMCQYPSIPHALAASFGAVVQSPFLGMIVISSCAVLLAYASLLALMRAPDESTTAISFIIFSLICLAGSGRRLPMIGNEIRGNFFFGQLVGTAVMLAFVAFFPRLRPTISLVAVFLASYVYPISAVQLGAAAICSMLFRKEFQLTTIFYIGLIIVAIRFHPVFKVSAGLASNDGAIATGIVPAGWTIYLAVSLLILSTYLAVWHQRIPLAAVGAGIAGAAIAQWGALTFFQIGAPYIVAKHLFGIVTMLAATGSVIMAGFINQKGVRYSPLAMIGGAIICTMAVLWPAGNSTFAFVKAERVAGTLVDPRDQFALNVGPIGMVISEAVRDIRD